MKKILFYDDSKEDLQTFGDSLRLKGFELTLIDNHIDTFTEIETAKEPPDVAIFDIENQYFIGDPNKIGVAVGIELGEAFKKRWSGTPLIFLSRHDGGSDLAQEIMDKKLASWYVDKSHKPQTLVKAVELVLWVDPDPDSLREQYSIQVAGEGGNVATLTVSMGNRDAEWEGIRLDLKYRQFLILYCLIKARKEHIGGNPDPICTYKELRDAAQIKSNPDDSPETSGMNSTRLERLKATIYQHVGGLRNKLKKVISQDPSFSNIDPVNLVAVKPGIGYFWDKTE